MLLKLISCNVFQREASWCIARSPHVIDVEYTELGEHVRSAGLREIIQGKIDATEASGKAYDAILLLFGLCGNATIGPMLVGMEKPVQIVPVSALAPDVLTLAVLAATGTLVFIAGQVGWMRVIASMSKVIPTASTTTSAASSGSL